jgi:uncharacterized membrane protein
MSSVRYHVVHHGRFYIGVTIGIASWFASGFAHLPPAVRLIASGDVFFFSYLASVAVVVAGTTPELLRKRAAVEDEGTFLVILIVLAVIAVSSIAVVTVLHQKSAATMLPLWLAIVGIPLGWCTLHAIAAFHYADLYYARKEHGPQSVRSLEFPETKEPGVWEFLYYAFTIGTTAQTSDTNVLDTRMRRVTLGHSIVSFFYNTALIAMAINALVAISS